MLRVALCGLVRAAMAVLSLYGGRLAVWPFLLALGGLWWGLCCVLGIVLCSFGCPYISVIISYTRVLLCMNLNCRLNVRLNVCEVSLGRVIMVPG